MSADHGSCNSAQFANDSFIMEELKSFRMKDGTIYAVVGHNPEAGIISEVWLGDFQTDENFKLVVSYLLEQLKEGSYRYWLADVRFVSSVTFPTKKFVFENLMPQAFSYGMEKFAIVFAQKSEFGPPQSRGVVASQALFKGQTDPRIAAFEDMKAAKEWLLSL